MLTITDLEVDYSRAVVALRGVSLRVPEGSVVALLGANGAGKTTTLRAVSGLLGLHRGTVRRGTIEFDGVRLDRLDAWRIVRAGLSQVLEGRRIFSRLTVEENLRAGAFTRSGPGVRATYDRVLEVFPEIRDRRSQIAGYLSGGEQQMLAMARALMAGPRLLLLDEPSLGLAPKMVSRIRDVVLEINRSGTSVLLVEQNVAMALSVASFGYVLETGRVAMEGPADSLAADEQIQRFYLGLSAAEHLPAPPGAGPLAERGGP